MKKYLLFLFLFFNIGFLFSQNRVKTNHQEEWVMLKDWHLTTKYNNMYQVCSGCPNLYYRVYRSKYKLQTNQTDRYGNLLYKYKFLFYFMSGSYYNNGQPANTEMNNIYFYYKGQNIYYHKWIIVGNTNHSVAHFSFWFDEPYANDWITFNIEKISIN